MAASSPLIINGRVVGAMRYVTSLRSVDRQIILIVGIALGIGLAILGMVYFSNLYFVRSIVDPVAGITDTAKRIAARRSWRTRCIPTGSFSAGRALN